MYNGRLVGTSNRNRGPGWKFSWRHVAATLSTLWNYYETSCQTNVSENIVETSTYRNIDLSSSASIVTSISNQWTQWKRIELMIHYWAQRYRSYLRDGRVGSLILSTVNLSPWMFIRLLFCRRTLPRRTSLLKNTVRCRMSILMLAPTHPRVLLSHCRVRMEHLRTSLKSPLWNLLWSHR